MLILTIYDSEGNIEKQLRIRSIEIITIDEMSHIIADNKKYFLDDFVISNKERMFYDSLWNNQSSLCYKRLVVTK